MHCQIGKEQRHGGATEPPSSPAETSNGERPMHSAYSTQPSDQQSTRSSMVQWEGGSQSSGARYDMVQLIEANSCSCRASRLDLICCLAGRTEPKSISTGVLLSLSSTLPGLRS